MSSCKATNAKVFISPGCPPRAAGCCDSCMTNIRWAYTVRTAEGVEFIVGSDCAQKCGMTVKEIKDARRSYRNEAGRECNRVQKANREQLERETNKESVGFSVTDAELNEAIQAGKSAAMYYLICARKFEAAHIGEVGKRARGLRVLVERVFSFDSAYGTKHIWILRDAANNCLVWKSTSCFEHIGADGQLELVTKADRYRMRQSRWFLVDATVKTHGERDGLKQTEIARPKVKSVDSDWQWVQ